MQPCVLQSAPLRRRDNFTPTHPLFPLTGLLGLTATPTTPPHQPNVPDSELQGQFIHSPTVPAARCLSQVQVHLAELTQLCVWKLASLTWRAAHC